MDRFLHRLKERKLVQWALAYLAGAWLLLQVFGELRDNFGWSPLYGRMLTVLLAVGFLAALVLAWYHGEQGRQRVSGLELLMLAGILVLAGTALAFVGRGGDSQAESSSVGASASLTLPRAERNSVAVLPFADLSADPENEYFSDGITDEILMTLANVGDLRVISRTSVMRYKNTDKSLREIAAELNVAHVQEGSVQRAGERVRINAQLIDAGTDAHLWAERYDRPLEDIFAVQSEIAQQIAAALEVQLTPAEQRRVERHPTTNLTAYDYVLRAREFLRRPSLRDSEAAIALLRKARELDPMYPDVYAAFAQAFAVRIWLFGDRMWLDSAAVAARRAIALDPQFALGYAQLGWALDWGGDRDGALEAHLRAVALNPNLSGGLANVYHWGFGRLDEAARWLGPALQADPTNNVIYWMAGWTYVQLGMPARARALLEKAIDFEPAFPNPHEALITALLLEGRREEARARIQRMLVATGEDPSALVLAGRAAMALGDLPTARRYFERGLPDAADWRKARGALSLAWILQQSGERERARELVQDGARRFERSWGGSPKRPEDFVDLARIRILEGDRDEALRQLEEGVRHGWRFIYDRPPDPILNSLRGKPRYERLMAEVEADVDRMRARVEREGW